LAGRRCREAGVDLAAFALVSIRCPRAIERSSASRGYSVPRFDLPRLRETNASETSARDRKMLLGPAHEPGSAIASGFVPGLEAHR